MAERWEVPLSIGAKTVLLHRMVADGVPVRFVNERGETVELVTGETFPRHVNVIHKPHYRSFDEETIQLIEERTGLKGIRAGAR